MKKNFNLPYIIVLILIFIAAFCLFFWKDKYRLEKYNLINRKNKLLREIREKEKLQCFLQKKFKRYLYSGYTLLLIAFLVISLFISLCIESKLCFDGILKGIGVLELSIIIIFLYKKHEIREFKYLFNQLSPFLKSKIYGEYINIDSEIDEKYEELKTIDEKISKL